MRKEVIESIVRNRLIVIVRGVDGASLLPFAEAMYEGGVRLLEVTFDAGGKTPDVETARNIGMLSEKLDGRMHIGAGTVLSASQVDLVKAAGGSFIISPDSAPEVIGRTREADLVSVPGAFSPTEIQAAHKAGADFVKLFPASELGPGYVKAIHAPLSHIKLLAVGGITLENMHEFTTAGVCGFGIGSSLANRKLIAEGRFGELRELAGKYIAAI